MASLSIAMKEEEEKEEEEEIQQGTRQLIRRFSQDVVENEPNNSLALHLEQATEREEKRYNRPWRRWYEDEDDISGDPDNDDLDDQAKILEQQWKSFSHFLESESEEVTAKRNRKFWKKKTDGANSVGWQVEGQSGQPPGLGDVIAAVRSVEQKWKEKDRFLGGKPQKLFRSFCNSLQGHSNMLQMLPSQNQYLSIFCGALTSLLEASANHQRISEGLGTALDDISSEIDLCVDNVKLMNVEDMRQAIGTLYSHIFHFLKSAMEWYQSKSLKKVLNSFNESFYDKFEGQIVKIKSLSEWLQKKGNLKSRAELRDLRLVVDQMAKQNARIYASLREERRKNDDWQNIGQSMLQMLRSSTEAWRFSPELRLPDIQPQENPFVARTLAVKRKESPRSRERTRSPRSETAYKKNSLQTWSRNLEDHTSVILDTLETLNAEISFIDPSVLESIQDWSQAETSQSLWVQGPFEDSYPSSTSEITGKVISIALTLKCPVLCFFCDLSNYHEGEDDDDTSPAALAVIDLVYSLIRQTIDLFPSQVTTRHDLGKSRFAKLNGSLDSFDKALRILGQLLSLAPSMMLVFIDGIEQLDDTEVESQVNDVLELLQASMIQTLSRKKKGRRVFKILYTTAGTCDALEILDEEYLEVVEAEGGTLRAELDLDFD